MDHNPPRRGRHRLTALLVLPLVLVLAGCFRMDLAVEINADETLDISIDFADLSGLMTPEDINCADLESEMDLSGAPEGVDFAVEQTDADGNLGCRMTASGASLEDMTGDGMSITREGDLYVFELDGSDEDLGDMSDLPAGMEPEVSIAVTFPGAVVDAGGGDVSGSTVTWEGLEAMSTGVRATGEAEESAAAGSPVLWIVLAVVALLVIAAAVFFLTRRRKPRGTEGPEDVGIAAAAGQPYPVPDGSGDPYGQAPAGYPPAGGAYGTDAYGAPGAGSPTAAHPAQPYGAQPDQGYGTQPDQGYGAPPAQPHQSYGAPGAYQPPPPPAGPAAGDVPPPPPGYTTTSGTVTPPPPPAPQGDDAREVPTMADLTEPVEHPDAPAAEQPGTDAGAPPVVPPADPGEQRPDGSVR